MIEDTLLIWRFKAGSKDALCRIYEKYKGHLLTLATALLKDVNSAEDAVHDVFVSFAQSRDRFRVNGSLKSFLATCVVNRARDEIRARRRQPVGLDEAVSACSNKANPEQSAICSEEMKRLTRAAAELPYEQWEAVVLRAKGGMRFREIARLQGVPAKTVQSRYRYGLDKLQSLLDQESKQ